MIDAATGWYVVPATLKAVVISTEGSVLLAKNHRGAWELPGGWPSSKDRTPADVLRREVFEETGLHVDPGPLLHADLVVVDGDQVMVIAYLCFASTAELSGSDEHTDLFWAGLDTMPVLEFDAYEVAVRNGLARPAASS